MKKLIVIVAFLVTTSVFAQQPPAANCITNVGFVQTNPAASVSVINDGGLTVVVNIPCPPTGPYTSIDIGYVYVICDPTTSCHCAGGGGPYTITMPAGFSTCIFNFHGDPSIACSCSLIEYITPGTPCDNYIPPDPGIQP